MSTTGRYFYHDPASGRRFCVEPISERSQKQDDKIWSNGGIDQVRGGSIREDESIITAENGFTSITVLPPGVSPDAFIQALIRGER
jgi:hypothetical protein